MVVIRNVFGEFEILDEAALKRRNGVMKDGEALVMSMSVMDAALQNTLRDKYPPQETPQYRGRPGFATMSATDSAQRAALQIDYDKRLSERWKSPPSGVLHTGASKAHTQTVRTTDIQAKTRDEMYAAHDRALEQRWRAGS